jgi:hypothetical protein
MKLIDLLESARCGPGQTPASKGFYFPKTIELPQKLRTYLVDTWEKSEQMREEVGGNLSLKIELSLPPKDNRVGWQKFAKVEFMPIDVKDGQFGNSVEIRPNKNAQVVANFHTHPSTPGGTNPQKCGYQPPSIEDVIDGGLRGKKHFCQLRCRAHKRSLCDGVRQRDFSIYARKHKQDKRC